MLTHDMLEYIKKSNVNFKQKVLIRDQAEVKDLKNHIEQFFTKCLKNNPREFSYFLAQYGGTKSDDTKKIIDSVHDKISNIAAFLNTYKQTSGLSTNVKKFKDDMDILEKNIALLEEFLKKNPIEITARMENLSSDNILNNFEVMKATIKNITNNVVDVDASRNKLYVPMVNFEKFDNKGNFLDILNKFKNDITKLQGENDVIDITGIEQIDLEIDTKMIELAALIEKINIVTNSIKINIKKMEQEYNFLSGIFDENFSGNLNSEEKIKESIAKVLEIIKVKDFDVIIAEINAENNNNLDANSNDALYYLKNLIKDYSTLDSRSKKRIINKYNEHIELNAAIPKKINLNLGYIQFNDVYTKRINNNVLFNTGNGNTKINTEIINKFNNRMSEENNMFNIDEKFIENPLMDLPVIVGGNPIEKIKKLIEKCEKYQLKILEYVSLENEYKKLIIKFNDMYEKDYAYSIFLILIMTNQVFLSNQIFYNFFNMGILNLYKMTLNNIIKEIETQGNKPLSKEILFIKKYYYVVIYKLHDFLSKITDPSNLGVISKLDILNITKLNIDSESSDSCSVNQTDKHLYKVIEEFRNHFLLLNYFKGIIENYREMYQNKIAIYCRINDINVKKDIHGFEELQNLKNFASYNEVVKQLKIEQPNEQEIKNLKYDDKSIVFLPHNCEQVKLDIGDKFYNNPSFRFKFTEVFDTTEFPQNESIGKYMMLDTQLSKQKSLCLITYGYSGTGKTYTLFGDANNINNSTGTNGLLQATLESLNGLETVYFRIYELYGLGIPYMNYWKDSSGKSRIDKINHQIFKYDVDYTIIEGLTEFTLINQSTKAKANINADENNNNEMFDIMINSEDILKFIDQTPTQTNGFSKSYNRIENGFTKVNANDINKTFNSFNMLIDQINKVRTKKQRIRSTPNNPVSSRSIIFYDFRLKFKDNDKETIFLVIDLPGREDIVNTYVSPYFNNDVIKNKILPTSYNKLKLFTTSLYLNPLAVGIFNPTEVINTFNGIDQQDFKNIINYKINFKFGANEANCSLKEELINNGDKKSENPWVLESIMKIDADSKGKDRISLRMSKDKFVYNIATKAFEEVKGAESKSNTLGLRGYAKDDETYTYSAVISIHLINRLIQMNRFDIIKKIYHNLIEETLNKELNKGSSVTLNELRDSGFKREDIDKNEIDKLNQSVTDILKFNYDIAGLEGIYINENIIGLIKHLGSDPQNIKKETDRNNFIATIKQQDDKANFTEQQRIARYWITDSLNNYDNGDIKKFYNVGASNVANLRKGNNFIGNDSGNWDADYQYLVDLYNPQKLFNNDEPLLMDILNFYMKQISSFKLFYLFGNFKDSKENIFKCKGQYSLLSDAASFINVINENS